jgi:hypothetical protein
MEKTTNNELDIIWKNSRGEWSRNHDLPASKWQNVGNVFISWYKNGQCRREKELPAVINIGLLSWFPVKENIHSCILANGRKIFIKDGVHIIKAEDGKEYRNKMNK